MVRVKNPNEYKHIGFEKATAKNSMYNAILKHKKTGKIKKIPFGHKKFSNFQDRTGLNLYPHLIHGDKERRKRFRARHKENAKHRFSSAFFAFRWLW